MTRALQEPMAATSAAAARALPAPVVPGVSGAVARGLDAIKEDYIKADLHFIASDELGGRDTPSPGLRKAARFIRARLMRLGITPAGDGGKFFHKFRLSRTALDGSKTGARLVRAGDERTLVFGEDYYFFPGGVGNSKAEGPVVFAGTGSEEDVAALELAGRWAFVWGAGRAGNSEVFDRLRAAADKQSVEEGLLGVIVATRPGQEDKHGSLRASGIARWLSRGSLRVVEKGKGKRAVFPQLYVSQEIGSLFTGASDPKLGADLGVRFSEWRGVRAEKKPIWVENVAGLWPGSDPELAKEVIIISAHYDHVGTRDGEIYNGADDNGSGTTGLLAIAEALVAHGPMKRSVLLLWVAGEEKGLLGSEAWTKNPTLDAHLRPVCNLNIDMIGRNAPDYLLITPTQEHPAYNGLTRLAEKLGPSEGFESLGSCDEYWSRSDHANFSEHLGIPVAFLFADVHKDYHRPTDTWEKIDFDKIRRVSRLVFRMLDALQDLDLAKL